jgi:hypothetical protein
MSRSNLLFKGHTISYLNGFVYMLFYIPLGICHSVTSRIYIQFVWSLIWICIGSYIIYVIYIYLLIRIVKHDFHIKWCSCRLILTQRVSHVDQKRLTFFAAPGVRVARPLVFCVVFCGSFVCLCVPFHFPIVFSVLQFTASDYLFDIYKRFLYVCVLVFVCRSYISLLSSSMS